MAKHILRNAYLSINSVDLSNDVDSLEVSWNVDVQPTTTMSAQGVEKLAGLEDNSFSVTFLQDYASSQVDATLSALIRAAAFAFEIRPDAGAVAPTNPKFTGNAVLSSYPPISGSVGDAHKVTAEFQVSGIITRATS